MCKLEREGDGRRLGGTESARGCDFEKVLEDALDRTEPGPVGVCDINQSQFRL